MKICLLYRDATRLPGLQKYLGKEYEVTVIALHEDYLDKVMECEAEIIVLDFMHDCGVIEDSAIVKGVRSVSRTPIFLALGRRVPPEYREHMFNAGVDGCVQAPFLKEELHARLAILGRKRDSLLFTGTTVRAGGVQMNLYTHEVFRGSRPLELTKTEYGILFHLLLHKHSIVRPEELNCYINHGRVEQSSAVNVHILNIRKKIGGLNIIRTVPHYGFLVGRPQ